LQAHNQGFVAETASQSEAASFFSGTIMLSKQALFFQIQIERCHELAGKAGNEGDREFWLQLAHRWEGLLRVEQSGKPNFEIIHKLKFERPVFLKRRAFSRRKHQGTKQAHI
jgi:hypothetical protein